MQTGAVRYFQTAAVVCAVLAVAFGGVTQVVLALLALLNLALLGGREWAELKAFAAAPAAPTARQRFAARLRA